MNIETNTQISASQTANSQQSKPASQGNNVNFTDELKSISSGNKQKEENTLKTEEIKKADSKKTETKEANEKKEKSTEKTIEKDNVTAKDTSEKNTENINNAIDVLKGAVEEITLINRTEENNTEELKIQSLIDDNINRNKNEELGLIDNNMNIQEPNEKLNAQMNTNMNFNSNGQPFAEFVNQDKTKEFLKSSEKDIAEEKAILSTMEENIAIANKNIAMKDSKTKTVTNEHGITKVNEKTNITVDIIANFDSVVMDKNDVDFFAKLVDGGVLDMSEVANSSKSSAVSKTLADLLAKSMNENKPVRIDFDNDISVIIKISKDGKISADFLPSSNVAEAYLKENLPLLRQKFDDNNIDYEELNQRKQKQDNNQDDRKKGRKDE